MEKKHTKIHGLLYYGKTEKEIRFREMIERIRLCMLIVRSNRERGFPMEAICALYLTL